MGDTVLKLKKMMELNEVNVLGSKIVFTNHSEKMYEDYKTFDVEEFNILINDYEMMGFGGHGDEFFEEMKEILIHRICSCIREVYNVGDFEDLFKGEEIMGFRRVYSDMWGRNNGMLFNILIPIKDTSVLDDNVIRVSREEYCKLVLSEKLNYFVKVDSDGEKSISEALNGKEIRIID